MADTTIQLVFSNPASGMEDEFNEWYDTIHLPQVLSIPGMRSAQRFDVHEAEINRAEGGTPTTHRYLTIYEMDGDVDEIMAKVRDAHASGAMTMSEALDLSTSVLSFWTSRGPKVSA